MRAFLRPLLPLIAAAALSACGSEVAPVTAPIPATPLYSESGCDPSTAFIPCDSETNPTGGGSSPTRVGVQIGYSHNQCLAPAYDSDSDGLDDGCEVALAKAFAPGLIVHVGECNWDSALDRVGGEYYYGVKRPVSSSTGRIRIGYLPAYYKDCGSHGHTGDSEFMFVDVSYDPDGAGGYSWQFHGALLSSHCGAEFTQWGVHTGYSTDPDCRWWGRDKWEGGGGAYVDVTRGAPRIWVSSGKHANYYSRDHCNGSLAGTWNIDHCYSYQQVRRYPVLYRWQNIDFPESGVWTGVSPRWGSPLPDRYAVESFNETTCDSCNPFHGWTRPRNIGSTPYGNILRGYSGWWFTSYAPPASECTYDPETAFFRPC